MISSNSFSSSSTTSSLSSGTDSKDAQMSFDDSKLFHDQHNDFPILTVSEISEKDERYWERRRKNNAAAKRSRERRRQHDLAMEQQIQNLKTTNNILQRQVKFLKHRLAALTSSAENQDNSSPPILQNQNNIQLEDISGLLSTHAQSMGRLSSAYLELHNSMESVAISNGLPVMSPNGIDSSSYQSERSAQFSNGQTPLDLSVKVKSEPTHFFGMTPPTAKTHSRSNSETSNLDQRYWDRRRRNNEAVRKCRQNKRAKMLGSANTNNNKTVNNTNHNSIPVTPANVDKVQIKTQIESITKELEKLKSRLKCPEIISSESPYACNIKMEESIKNLSQRHHLNEDCKKTMKWKNKLIEADQADKEILNQIRV